MKLLTLILLLPVCYAQDKYEPTFEKYTSANTITLLQQLNQKCDAFNAGEWSWSRRSICLGGYAWLEVPPEMSQRPLDNMTVRLLDKEIKFENGKTILPPDMTDAEAITMLGKVLLNYVYEQSDLRNRENKEQELKNKLIRDNLDSVEKYLKDDIKYHDSVTKEFKKLTPKLPIIPTPSKKPKI